MFFSQPESVNRNTRRIGALIHAADIMVDNTLLNSGWQSNEATACIENRSSSQEYSEEIGK